MVTMMLCALISHNLEGTGDKQLFITKMADLQGRKEKEAVDNKPSVSENMDKTDKQNTQSTAPNTGTTTSGSNQLDNSWNSLSSWYYTQSYYQYYYNTCYFYMYYWQTLASQNNQTYATTATQAPRNSSPYGVQSEHLGQFQQIRFEGIK
jgi:hypothetical protein